MSEAIPEQQPSIDRPRYIVPRTRKEPQTLGAISLTEGEAWMDNFHEMEELRRQMGANKATRLN